MLIKLAKAADARPSEITPKWVFMNRRRFMRSAAAAGLGVAAGSIQPVSAEAGIKLLDVTKSPYSTDEEPASLEAITTYNKFLRVR